MMRTMRTNALAATVLLLAASLGGCTCGNGPGPDGNGDPPVICNPRNQEEDPMLVGMGASPRAMIEASMTKGIVVVRYEGCDIEPLDCTVEGAYERVPITAARDQVWMKSETELGATVPLSAIELSGEFKRNRIFRLDYVVVEQNRASVRGITRQSLSGPQCDQATHWVRAAMLGASTLLSQSETAYSAGIKAPFGIGGHTGGQSEARNEKENGQIDQCSMEGAEHGTQCKALLQLDLVPLQTGEEPPPLPPGQCPEPFPAGAQTADGTLAQGDSTIRSGEFVDNYLVQGAAGSPMRIGLESDQFDPYLFVRTPSGRQLDNDDLRQGCRNAAIDIGLAEGGAYVVSVTSFQSGETGAYRLGVVGGTISVPRADPGPGPGTRPGTTVVRPPDPPNASNFGTAAITPGFTPDPHTVAGRSGGDIQARSWSPACAGWVTSRADHLLQLQGDFGFLRIYAVSTADVTLVVRTPSGTFLCADDISTSNRNPLLEGGFQAGTYQIWIGSYDEGQEAPYQLSFTELQSNHP